jgi:hypothetical protein
MDGIIGLIVFAIISFVYNKLIQKQDAKNGDASDLSEWLEEAGPKSAPPVQKLPNEKMTQTTVAANQKKIQKKYVQQAIPPPAPVFNTKNINTKTNYRSVHSEKSQSSLGKHLTNIKKKKRSSLNCKDRKTLRQAFILNTVLTKPKSYEP